MSQHTILTDPNNQLKVAFLVWLYDRCLFGPQYATSNLDLLEDFGWCRDDYGFRDFWIEPEEFDTLLAWAGLEPTWRRDDIIWRGIARRFDNWDPEETPSPFRRFPKILK